MIRVPLEVAKVHHDVGLDLVLLTLRLWKIEVNEASDTSPRWIKMKQLFKDLDNLGLN